jgi:hypothetical protein
VKNLLTVTALLLLAQGLWNHNWRTILASLAVAVIWPLISAEIYEDAEHEQLLDRLWDDEAA